MYTLVIIVHIIVCLVLICAVLLQSGKAADLAGAFGGGGSQTAFGGRGSTTILSKVTTACAIVFMFTSIGLWILSAKSAKSVVSGESAPKAAATKPATEPKKNETPAPPTETKAQQPTQNQNSNATSETKK